MSSCPHRFAALTSCLLLGAAALGATDLAPNSPFLAAGASATTRGTPDGRNPELRGIMSGPDGTLYCIFDPSKKTSSWVGVNESGFSFVVAAADPNRESVSLVTTDGRKLELALRAAKVTGGPQYVAPSGPDFSKLNPQQAQAQIASDAARERMARRRMEHLEAVKSGTIAPDRPSVPESP
jgi:hypothetical protein